MHSCGWPDRVASFLQLVRGEASAGPWRAELAKGREGDAVGVGGPVGASWGLERAATAMPKAAPTALQLPTAKGCGGWGERPPDGGSPATEMGWEEPGLA